MTSELKNLTITHPVLSQTGCKPNSLKLQFKITMNWTASSNPV